jgi:hypothetical protein
MNDVEKMSELGLMRCLGFVGIDEEGTRGETIMAEDWFLISNVIV